MEKVAIRIPNGAKVNYQEKFSLILNGGISYTDNKELIKEILIRPGICRIDPVEVFSKGYFTEAEMLSFGYKVGQLMPEAKPQEPIVVKKNFAIMSLPELRQYAEENGILLRRNWDKDRIVATIEKSQEA